MNGPAVFNFTLDKVPKLINTLLEINSISFDNIDYFIFHQANAFMLKALRDKLKIPENRFVIDLETSGNLVSASIPNALANMDVNKLKSKNILLVGFGVGFSWSGVLYQS